MNVKRKMIASFMLVTVTVLMVALIFLVTMPVWGAILMVKPSIANGIVQKAGDKSMRFMVSQTMGGIRSARSVGKSMVADLPYDRISPVYRTGALRGIH